MAFPSVVYGSPGDEKVAQSTKIAGLPLGTRMIIEGSVYAHAQASATALVAGRLYAKDTWASIAGSAMVTYQDGSMAVAAAGAVGATQVTVTAAASGAVTKDVMEDGYLFVGSTITANQGLYRIKSNAAAAAGSSCVIKLADNEAIKVALAAGTTTVGVQLNEFKSLTLSTANTTYTGPMAGVAVVPVAADYYCWIQRRGPVSVLVDNTLVLGEACVASTVAAGAVGPYIIQATGTTKIKQSDKIGEVMNVAASAQMGLIYLKLE